MKRFTGIAIAVCMSASGAFGRPSAPTLQSTYDGLAPGGRAIAMGLAATAVADDSSAIYFNPAGLALLGGNSIGLTYEAARQSSLTYDQILSGEALQHESLVCVSLTGPKGSFAWRPLSDVRTRTVNGADWEDNEVKVSAYTFSVSHEHNSHMYSGLNLHYLSGLIGQSKVTGNVPYANISSGYGFAADFGMLFVVAPEFRLGVTLQNLGGFMWWDDYETDLLPLTVRGGFAFQIAKFTTFASDVSRRYYRISGQETTTHFGFEQILGLLQLRAGVFGTDLNDQNTTHLSAGFGYEMNKYRLSLSGEKYRLNLEDVYRYVFSIDLPI